MRIKRKDNNINISNDIDQDLLRIPILILKIVFVDWYGKYY